jgi:hypothetical protein
VAADVGVRAEGQMRPARPHLGVVGGPPGLLSTVRLSPGRPEGP